MLDEVTNPRAGTEQQLLLLLDRLDREAVEPSVTVFRSSPFVADWPVRECPISCLNISSVKSPAAVLKLMQFAWRLRRDRVDIVHVLLNDAAVVAPLMAWLAGATVLAARRDLGFWHTPSLLRLLRLSNRFVDRIVVNSEAVLRAVAGVERYPVDKIAIIHNGFDEARLALPVSDVRGKLGISQTTFLVGVVANLNPWKRHCDLIRAVAQLVSQGMDIQVVVIGEGPERRSLASLADALGISDRIHLLGSVPDPIAYIKAVDVGVLCSETEGASNALIEYMCCGIPIVLTDIAANRELAAHAENARFYPSGDIDALARALGLQLHASRVSPGTKQAPVITAHFGSGRMAGEYTRLYRALSPWRAGRSVLPGAYTVER